LDKPPITRPAQAQPTMGSSAKVDAPQDVSPEEMLELVIQRRRWWLMQMQKSHWAYGPFYGGGHAAMLEIETMIRDRIEEKHKQKPGDERETQNEK